MPEDLRVTLHPVANTHDRVTAQLEQRFGQLLRREQPRSDDVLRLGRIVAQHADGGKDLTSSGVDRRQQVAAVALLMGGPGEDVEAGEADDADTQRLRQRLGCGDPNAKPGEKARTQVDRHQIDVADLQLELEQHIVQRRDQTSRRVDACRSR